MNVKKRLQISILFLGIVSIFIFPNSIQAYIFNNSLNIGDKGTDVSSLQQILKDKGYFSHSITGYFGSVTQESVKKFQQANNLETVGSVGPLTRDLLNNLTQSNTPRPLHIGLSGNDVSELQQFLKIIGLYTYPTITGYFGEITKVAVTNFQKVRGIEPIGIVGPQTRAKITELSKLILTPVNTTAITVTTPTIPTPTPSPVVLNAYAPGFGGGGDSIPPVLSSGSPSGTLALNTTSTTLSVATNEVASCKYSTNSGSAYSSMTAFTTTGSTSHSMTVSNLTNGSSYVYYIKCQDNLGNANTTDYTVSFTVAADTTSPTVTVTAPANNSTVTGSAVTLSATATDDVSVSGVQFKLDTNTLIGSEDISSPYGVMWNSTAVADGSHTIIAVGRDGVGNYATSSVITVAVDNTGPVISLISSGIPEDTTATTTWTTDEVATSQVEYGLTNSYGLTSTLDSLLVTSHSVVLSGLTASTLYHFRVRSTDASGNLSVSSDQTFTTNQAGYIGRVFDGSSSNTLELSPSHASQLIEGASQITTIARVWVDSAGSGGRSVFSAELGENLNGIALVISSTGKIEGDGRSKNTDSFQSKLGATTVPTNAWHTIAAINDIANDTINVYLDGVLDTSGSASVTFGASVYTSGSSFLGKDRIGDNSTPTGTEPFNGKIADVAVFARALSTTELLAITNGQRPSAASGGEPVLYFPLDEATDGPGRFAYSKFGGLQGLPVGDVPPNTGAKPTVNAHTAITQETRFVPTRVWRLKASDVLSVGDGNAVSSVVLRNAGVLASQSSSGNQPIYKSLSGDSAIRFASTSSQYLTVPGKIDLLRGVTVVVLADSRDNDRRIFSASQSATSDSQPNSVVFTSNNGLMVFGGSVGYSVYTDYTVNSSGLALFSGRFSGREVANWLNGVKRNGTVTGGTELSDGSFRPTDLPSASTEQLIQLGRRLNSSASNLYWSGDIYDMIIVNGALTDEEVRYLEGVMAWEDGKTSLLPSNHPWKNIQPTLASLIAYPWGNSLVDRSDAPATSYLGSPGFLSANGKLYAMHDYFDSGIGGGAGRLYVSNDGGISWYGLANFPTNFQWGSIWQHTDGNLYFVGTSIIYGDVVLKKSTDEGATWSSTTLSSSGGPLPPAGSGITPPNYHKSGGINPLYYNNHLFIAIEDLDPYTRSSGSDSGFQSLILYAPDNVDLTNKANWATTTALAIGAHSFSSNGGFIEGNAVVDDIGNIYNVLRFHSGGVTDKAVFLPQTWNGTTLSNPTWNSSYIKDLPGGTDKFQLIKNGGYFYSLTNNGTSTLDQRNRVVLVSGSSADLSSPSFSPIKTIIDENDLVTSTGMSLADSIAYHGFQYPSLDISGSTVRALYRVGWSGANSYHDSNFIGFGTTTLP
ncbi:MAG: peptidoglycan-binding protein [Candidatus Paceibacterota bacterium]